MIDEAHEGVDTYRTDVAFDHIQRSFTLHLSGTPFKAIANDKFPEAAIFNWTYADEQKAKRTSGATPLQMITGGRKRILPLIRRGRTPP